MGNKEAQKNICENCGGSVVYDITSGKLKCQSCESVYDVDDSGDVKEYIFNEAELAKASVNWNALGKTYKCTGCGEEMVTDSVATTIECPYCGSKYTLDDRQSAGVQPEAIVLFNIDKNDMKSRFARWIKGKKFAPNALKYLYQSGKLIPMYLPFWTYDADAYAKYKGQGGTVYYVTVKDKDGKSHQERRVRWTSVSGDVSQFFDDVLIYANNKNADLIDEVAEFDTKSAKPFDKSYVSGYHTEKYIISPKEGFTQAQSKMEQVLRGLAHQDILRSYDEAQVSSLAAKFSRVTFKHILAPFWISSYHFKEKLYNVICNGQTGEIKGEYPVSKVKVGLTIVASLIIAGILLYLYAQYGE